MAQVGGQRLREDILKCDFVRFTVTDFHGIPRGRSIARPHLNQYLDNGLPTFQGLLSFGPRGQMKVVEGDSYGNMIVRPLPSTFHLLPWATGGKYQVGELLCEAFLMDGRAMETCPRYLARKQLERLGKAGFSFSSGWEAEFFLFDKKTQQPIFDGNDQQAHLVLSEHEGFFYDMITQLRESGMEVEGIEAEYGPGQIEMVTKPTDGIKGVDMVANLKEAVKEIAMQNGYQATFMTKPDLQGLFSSGSHHNFSILDTKSYNNLTDRNKKYKMSDFAQHWVAGMIKHAAGLTALCCPTVNCYRRLHGLAVPDLANWGHEDRTVFVRAKEGPRGCFLENRLPSSACNPYLLVAATIAAGLDGVSKRLKCPPEKDKAAMRLPNTLAGALNALEDDTVLTEAVGAEFVREFIATKRQLEVKELDGFDPKDTNNLELFEKERKMYFKFL